MGEYVCGSGGAAVPCRLEVGAAGKREVTGAWKVALGASAVLAGGAGLLASPAAGATAPPVERASATAVAILTPSGRETGGTPTVFAWETPASGRGYRFPDDGSLLRIGHVAASAERGSGDAITANGAVVLRSVELFGGLLRVDVVRAAASLVASDGAIADTSASHLVHVRLNGDPIKLVPGKKVWVKGWGYAVVDDPVARTDSTGGGDTLAGLRLHLTSAHAGLPAGTDIVLGRVHADLAHIPPAPASQPGGSGGSGSTGTLPDRQANAPGTHHRPVRRHRTRSGDARRRGTTGTRRGCPRPSSTLSPRRFGPPTAPEHAPRSCGRLWPRSAGRTSGAARAGRRAGSTAPASLTMPMPGPAISFPGARRRTSSGRCPSRSRRPT